jgi:hypothetical protein
MRFLKNEWKNSIIIPPYIQIKKTAAAITADKINVIQRSFGRECFIFGSVNLRGMKQIKISGLPEFSAH